MTGSAAVYGNHNVVNVTLPGVPPASTTPVPERPALPGSLPLGSSLPFTRNALFTGREADLEQLETTLLSEHPASTLISQAIQGMGGIGKTQLAIEFAFRHCHQFKGIHWLDLHDPAQLDSEIARCGAEMLLPDWPKEQPEQVRLTLAAWKRDGPRLLILDNFEEPRAGRAVLARLQDPNVRIIITSRHSDWSPTLGLQPLALEVFSTEESIEFLRKYTGERFTKDELKQLADRLGCLALALELAGRYLQSHPRLAMGDYRGKLDRALEHASMRDLHADALDAGGHDPDLLRTFALSWQQVKNETARKAFMIAGYCAPNTPVPMEVFELTQEAEPAACDEAINELQGLGLLKEGPAIHPLLAEYARSLDDNQATLNALADELGQTAIQRNKDAETAGNYQLLTPLVPHLRSLAEAAAHFSAPGAGRLWNEIGFYLQRLADYAGARTALERALKIDESAFGPDHPKVAIRVNNLGGVLQDLGDLPGAKAAFERALKINEAAYGPDHPKVATCVNNLGLVLQNLGDLQGAKAAHERALKIDEAAYGPDHSDVAIDVNNLGSVLYALGDLPGAKAAYERGLKIDEAVFGPNHPNVAIRVSNLGGVLQDLGDLPGAGAAYERALKIIEAAFDPNHPNVATAVNNLGSVLQDQGDLPGARAAFERAISIDERTYGLDHPEVATDVGNLGALLEQEGDAAGARAAYERALRIFKQFLPEGHPKIKSAENALRRLQGKQG